MSVSLSRSSFITHDTAVKAYYDSSDNCSVLELHATTPADDDGDSKASVVSTSDL